MKHFKDITIKDDIPVKMVLINHIVKLIMKYEETKPVSRGEGYETGNH